MNKRLTLILILALCMGALAGCQKKQISDAEYEEIAKQKAADNSKKVVMTITKGGIKHDVTMDMLTYHLAYEEAEGNGSFESNKEYYQVMYGDDVNYWDIKVNDTETVGDQYKDVAYASAYYALLMYYEACDANMTLTDVRRNALDSYTKKFLDKFTPEQRAKCGMTEEVIRATYERLFMADQFKEVMASNIVVDREDVMLTIDREDYREYQTNYLFLTKSNDNADLALIAGDTDKRRELMKQCFEEAKSGKSLQTIQMEHNQILTLATRDFQKADPNSTAIDPDYLSTAYEMLKGEYRFLECNYGFYVIQMVDNLTFYGYEDAVTEAVEKKKTEEINEIFKKVEKLYKVETNDAWDDIKMGTILQSAK